MSFKHIEYTKLNLDGDDLNKPTAQTLNADFDDGENELFTQNKVDSKDQPEEAAGPSLWSFKFYQNLFDINTYELLYRLLFSFLPNPRRPFLQSRLQTKPDLYGPFWSCTTLIIVMAVAGNIVNYLQFTELKHYWKYDFKKLSLAAFTVYCYWWIMPLLVWGFVKAKKLSESATFLDLLSLFGYSMAIYVPISALWMVQIKWFQWLLVVVALVSSGSVLLLSLWTKFAGSNRGVALIIVVAVAVLHSCLAVGFMLYFFYVPKITGSTIIPVTNTSKT